MKFKRLLTAGLMALFCAGTATAASQLNSVHVTPKDTTATVRLQTTGTFAHKEYRPDGHLLLIDLSGVTADPSLVRTVAFRSAVLKSYTLSSYTSAAGIEVTRVEITLGENVTADVVDASDGLQVLLSGGAPSAGSAPSSNAAGASLPATAVPAAAARKEESASSSHPLPQNVAPAAQKAGTQPVAMTKTAEPAATSGRPSPLTPTVIRNVSVRRGHDTLDVVVEGPSSANPYLLKNPDRLVLDFSNAVLRPGVRNIAVHTKDVLRVRVGRFQAAPPVTRVVIDLNGPRGFEVEPSADGVVVRVKAEAGVPSTPVQSAPAPVPVPAVVPATMERPASVTPRMQKVGATNAAMAVATPLKEVSLPLASNTPAPIATPVPSSTPAPSTTSVASNTPAPSSVAQSHDQPASVPSMAAGMATDVPAPASPAAKAAGEMARLNQPGDQLLEGAATASPSAAPAKPKYTGEPISVNLKDVDLKDFFRLIHEISGLNIVLDPSVRGTVTLVLDDVPWDQALDIVLKNNSLDRELQGNVLRIAATDTLRREAVDRRAQAEAVALAVDRQTITRSLSYAKASEVVPTIKKFLTARGDVISDVRTNSLIISDIPSVLPNLDRLISQLDKKTQEVEIEVRVVSATRSFSRDLGFQLGFNWGNGVTTIGGTNPNLGTSGLTGPAGNIPLFSNFPAPGATTGISFSNITSNYGIDAILTAAESHNLAKVLSRPRIVTQSNVKAEVKQGVQLPVYTAGTANSNASVSYLAAELRLSVTPQITADNTIFLTVDVENTQPEGEANGNGNFILSTQQATTQVLVSDGATVVIGGVIQTTNSVSTIQTPFLGDIPWLGNLFKERHVSTETDELIFFITPKIIQT
ncbi:MAG: type IV pilus secretin PilQ [Candidatus Korobacteraceae bacterium]